jgi:hypothetical protein
MRAPPPIDVALTRFGCWRGALASLAVCTAAVTAAWLVASFDQQPAPLLIGVATVAASVLGILLSAVRVPAVELRWDGAGWWCAARSGARADLAVQGNLTVALDLGSWLLLRFVPAGSSRRVDARWLPVQRRGLEPQWHALRCAVHAPTPARAPR